MRNGIVLKQTNVCRITSTTFEAAWAANLVTMASPILSYNTVMIAFKAMFKNESGRWNVVTWCFKKNLDYVDSITIILSMFGGTVGSAPFRVHSILSY